MRTSLRKAYEITDAKIQFVSLVDKAANLRKFLLTKADGGKASFTTYGRIIKADAENHYVTGIVYEPMAEDSQGNYMTEAEITKAAYYFAKNGDKVDLQHSFEPLEGATVVETWIAKADFEIGGEEVKKGTWLMTVEVTDASVWESIEKGDITGFSMGGIGNYSEEDVELDDVTKQDSSGKKGLFKQLAEALGFNVVEKGAMAELYEERSKGTLFWNAFNSLEEVLYTYDPITGRWRYESDEAKVRECLEDFNGIITTILTGGQSITKAIQDNRPVEKAGKKMSSKNRETLTGICESLTAFLKEFDDPEPEGTEEEPDNTKSKKEDKEVTKQEVEQVVEAAITKALGAAQGQAAPAGTPATTPNAVEKAGQQSGTAPADTPAPDTAITPEAIEKMVSSAIEKAMKPQQQETVSAEQVASMIESAVAKAVEPVLKSRGLPSNLGGDGAVEKQAGEEPHYLHGIL
jgi:hypothetical protein